MFFFSVIGAIQMRYDDDDDDDDDDREFGWEEWEKEWTGLSWRKEAGSLFRPKARKCITKWAVSDF